MILAKFDFALTGRPELEFGNKIASTFAFPSATWERAPTDRTLSKHTAMKVKDIHDYLLSLFVRGLGFWLLYLSIDRLTTVVSDIDLAIHPSPYKSPDWSDILYLAVKVATAAYFILGAPPFLKWATRGQDT